MIDVAVIRKDFPILDRERTGGVPRLVYLDSASSAQKPSAVLDAMQDYYETTHANVHRGVYAIAEEATARYEGARAKVARFLGGRTDEIVFTKNVTEAVNLFVQSWGRANLKAGDAVLLTEMEHHSMLVPWLMLAPQLGVELRYLARRRRRASRSLRSRREARRRALRRRDRRVERARHAQPDR